MGLPSPSAAVFHPPERASSSRFNTWARRPSSCHRLNDVVRMVSEKPELRAIDVQDEPQESLCSMTSSNSLGECFC